MDVPDPLKILVYSPPGYGKTVLMGSALGDERWMPMLLIDFEGGLRSIRRRIRRIPLEEIKAEAIKSFLKSNPPTADKIDVISLQSYEDFNEIYEFLANDNEWYRTVTLDSLSEVNALLLGGIVADAAKNDRHHDPDIAEQRDYLRSYSLLKKLVRAYRDLSIHVLMSSHSNPQENPITRRLQAAPNLNGKLAFEVPGMIDYTFYLAKNEETGDRILLTDANERFYAKQRSDIDAEPLPGQIENPTLSMLMDLVELEDESAVQPAAEPAQRTRPSVA